MSRRFVLLIAGTILSIPVPASAHERQMECSDVGMRGVMVDIQGMQDGEAKMKAMSHMKIAEEAIAKHDMEGCMTHMQAAMEAIDKR
jgi:hypothetical protein